MIKHYGRDGFPSDRIVDYSIRLINIALNITWNNLQWRLYFFMKIDITSEILNMNVHFDIKRQVNILSKISSDSNARNIILYCEFLIQCLGMPSERFLAWTRKHSPTFLRQILDICVSRVSWRSTWKLICCFLIVQNARHILTMVCKVLDVPFEWGIYIDMYYRPNFLFDQPTLLKSSWYFLKKDFKPKICLRAWRGTQE